jgi:serine/threonine protein kinase
VRDQWGKYRLDALLARGGMAEVYRAAQIGPSGFARTVCLKMVRAEHCGDEEFVAMFRREAQIAAALQHPNIVQVFDFDQHEGRLFLAMEYVEGLDLRDVLRQTGDLGLRVPAGFALHVAEGLLAALRCAHAHAVDGEPRPVVHRDVSPHNLLVSVDGLVKLADFGIAKALGASSATRTGVVKGKLAYLSPEQAGGGDVGPSSDLYCAGLVLFEMLAGRRLYAGRNEQEVLALALRPNVPELPWLSPALNGFLARLLAADPGDRFEGAERALEELAALRAEAPYAPAEAGGLVKALLGLRIERGSTGMLSPSARSPSPSTPAPAPPAEPAGARSVSDDPTRTSSTGRGVAKSGASRVAIAIGIAAVVLCAGLGIGWALAGGQEAPEPGAPGTASPTVAAPAVVAPALAAAPGDEGAKPDAAEIPPAAVAPEPAAGKAAPSGWLQVNCRPWAEVALDGKPIGTTPINKLRVAAGPHKLLLTNAEAGYREEIAVKVGPGRTVNVNRKVPGA